MYQRGRFGKPATIDMPGTQTAAQGGEWGLEAIITFPILGNIHTDSTYLTYLYQPVPLDEAPGYQVGTCFARYRTYVPWLADSLRDPRSAYMAGLTELAHRQGDDDGMRHLSQRPKGEGVVAKRVLYRRRT